MSVFDEVKKVFEQTLQTNKKRVKLKLDFNAPPSQEKEYTLINYEVSEDNKCITIFVSNHGEMHTVLYSDLFSVNYADNGERYKIWVEFEEKGKDSQRFYLYYAD